MKKWKTIRDNFVRELMSLNATETGLPASKKKKPYIFFDQLSFLLPHVKGYKNNGSNITAPNVDPADQDERLESNQVPTPSAIQRTPPSTSAAERQKRQERAKKRPAASQVLSSATKNITNIMEESLQLQKSGLESDKFGNKAFLLSFLPTFDNFSPELSFDVRMQITEVFRTAMRRAANPYDSYDQNEHGYMSYPFSSTPSSSGVPQRDIEMGVLQYAGVNMEVPQDGTTTTEAAEYEYTETNTEFPLSKYMMLK